MFSNFHAWTNFNKSLEIERNCCNDSYKCTDLYTPIRNFDDTIKYRTVSQSLKVDMKKFGPKLLLWLFFIFVKFKF